MCSLSMLPILNSLNYTCILEANDVRPGWVGNTFYFLLYTTYQYLVICIFTKYCSYPTMYILILPHDIIPVLLCTKNARHDWLVQGLYTNAFILSTHCTSTWLSFYSMVLYVYLNMMAMDIICSAKSLLNWMTIKHCYTSMPANIQCSRWPAGPIIPSSVLQASHWFLKIYIYL